MPEHPAGPAGEPEQTPTLPARPASVTYRFTYPTGQGPLTVDEQGQPMRLDEVRVTLGYNRDGSDAALTFDLLGHRVDQTGARQRAAAPVRAPARSDFGLALVSQFAVRHPWREVLNGHTAAEGGSGER